MVGVVLTGWMLVAAQLFHVQTIRSKQLSEVAARQREIVVDVPARPADIVDRNGKLLATTIVVPSLFVDPSRLNVERDVFDELAESLSLDAEALAQRLERFAGKRFMWVKRQLTDEEIERVSKLEWPDGSHGFRDEFLRQYPQGRMAAHVLGLRDIDGLGIAGAEQSLDHLIQGRPGRRRLVRDALGRIVEVNFDPDNEPRRFEAVQLTIDLPIQRVVEEHLDQVIEKWKPSAASVIVMDPRSGEILAMASRPTYSPADRSSIAADAWRNQAINIVYEPGSTFKPFIVAWALQQGVLKPDEVFHCENGEYRMGRRILKDHHPYSDLNVTDILVKSSNIGMAKIGERLTNAGLYDASVTFGFGRPTGIELPGELSGILRPLRKWNSYSTGSIPMGQELAVTPLQLITAHAALANNGRLTVPSILHGVRGNGSDHDTIYLASSTGSDVGVPARIVTQTVDPEIAAWLVEDPLYEVIERGTGRNAKLKDWNVFGKTGTAQKMNPETGGYSETLYTSSFICGAPANDPRVLVLVVVDEPDSGKTHYGGTIAAPAASKILEWTLRYLRVPPNRRIRSAQRN